MPAKHPVPWKGRCEFRVFLSNKCNNPLAFHNTPTKLGMAIRVVEAETVFDSKYHINTCWWLKVWCLRVHCASSWPDQLLRDSGYWAKPVSPFGMEKGTVFPDRCLHNILWVVLPVPLTRRRTLERHFVALMYSSMSPHQKDKELETAKWVQELQVEFGLTWLPLYLEFVICTQQLHTDECDGYKCTTGPTVKISTPVEEAGWDREL